MIPVRFKWKKKNRTFYTTGCEPLQELGGTLVGVVLYGRRATRKDLYQYDTYCSLGTKIGEVKYNGKIYNFGKRTDIELFLRNIELDLTLDSLPE